MGPCTRRPRRPYLSTTCANKHESEAGFPGPWKPKPLGHWWAGWGLGLREGQVDFGYRFAKSFWGQGFGTEVAQAVLAYGMAQYQFVHCTAAAFVENTASRRILEKLGFRVERYGEQYGKRVAYYI